MNQYKPEGMLISSHKNHEYISTVKGLETALEKGIILEAPAVLCDHNFNLHIELPAGIRAIIPRNETQYVGADEEIKDIAIAGGVSANSGLRNGITETGKRRGWRTSHKLL